MFRFVDWLIPLSGLLQWLIHRGNGHRPIQQFDETHSEKRVYKPIETTGSCRADPGRTSMVYSFLLQISPIGDYLRMSGGLPDLRSEDGTRKNHHLWVEERIFSGQRSTDGRHKTTLLLEKSACFLIPRSVRQVALQLEWMPLIPHSPAGSWNGRGPS